MIEVSSCVICEQPIKLLKKALVAPFVAEWTWNRKPFCVDLVAVTTAPSGQYFYPAPAGSGYMAWCLASKS
jgi:hypothetical protein